MITESEINSIIDRTKRRIKRIIIKKLMKLCERYPSIEDYHLCEVYNHRTFTEGTHAERILIMLKSSSNAYLDEKNNKTFELLFNYDFSTLKGKTVLDVGCFAGGRAVAWAERWQLEKIYGIDIVDNHIKAAQNFADMKGIDAEFVCAMGERLPFRDRMFDAIVNYDVLEHAQDVRMALKESYRVLKDGGKIFIAFPSFYGLADHHLGRVTLTPLIHIIFSGEDLIAVYNEIIKERGEEAVWYSRKIQKLEAWEKGNTLNGMSSNRFAKIIKETDWKIIGEYHNPILKDMSKRYWPIRLLRTMLYPLAGLPFFKEFISTRIVYILEKKGNSQDRDVPVLYDHHGHAVAGLNTT